MHRPLAIVAAAAALAAAFATWAPAFPTSQSDLPRLPRATLAGEQTLYGHIRSLQRRQGRFELRIDPAYFVSGLTARRASLEDGADPEVPNDYYIVEDGHRLLTYVVPPTARASIVSDQANQIAISVSELAAIVRGGNPKGRPISGATRTRGFWIRARGDTVRSLDQQYQP